MLGIQKPQIKVVEVTDTEGVFIVEPLERGLGYTIGNSMRRILLSSIPGAAVTSVRIAGVQHEYTAIEGVKEDVLEILLNLKELIIKMDQDEPARLKLKAEGPCTVTAGDIEVPSNVEIVNKDFPIATLTRKGKLEMEMIVEKGRGYASAEDNEKETDPIGVIPLDSVFSPIVNVMFEVGNTRVGQRTDFDRVKIVVKTNGAIRPDEAVTIGARILIEHFSLFGDLVERVRETQIFEPTESRPPAGLETPITDLDLNVRAYNCLHRARIETLADLVDHTEDDLLGIRNLGAKTVELIKEKLAERGLSLKSQD